MILGAGRSFIDVDIAGGVGLYICEFPDRF